MGVEVTRDHLNHCSWFWGEGGLGAEATFLTTRTLEGCILWIRLLWCLSALPISSHGQCLDLGPLSATTALLRDSKAMIFPLAKR